MVEDSVILNFTGDLCCQNRFEEALTNGIEILSAEIKEILLSSDATIYNFEGSIAEPGQVPQKKYFINNCQNIVPYLKSVGKPIFNLANNHIMDFGNAGLQKTIDYLNKNNISYLGAGTKVDNALKPIIVEKNGIKVFIWAITAESLQYADNMHPGTLGRKHLKYIRKTISLKQPNVFHILCFHGGEEYSFYPMPYKRRFLRKLARKISPDVIIAHHSHTIQGAEKFQNTHIFYSLGNFMFDYNAHKHYQGTEFGLILNLRLNKKGLEYNLVTSKINFTKAEVSVYKSSPFENVEDILNLNDYKTSVLSDAYRVVFGQRYHKAKVNNAQKSPPLKIHNLIASKIKFYWGIITDRFLFSLYFSALKFKIMHHGGA